MDLQTEKTNVFFLLSSNPGGAERVTINISSFLPKDRYNVTYILIGNDVTKIKELLSEEAITLHLRVASFKDGLIFKLIKLLIRTKPDIVMASLMPINWRVCFASLFYKPRKLILRSNNYLYTQSSIQRWRLRLSYKFADKLIVQTSEMRDEHIRVLGITPSKVVTLANPLNTINIDRKLQNAKSPFNDGHTNYVFVGRIARVKGLDILLVAFAKVLQIQKNAFLHLVGDISGEFDTYYRELMQQGFELGIQDNIKFEGFSSNPYIYMKFADCFVLSSRNEGLPNVVLESLYLQTPVAVTKCIPVIARIVENGKNGYLAEVDEIDSLVNAMLAASKLGRVQSTYKSATKQNFLDMF